MDLPVYIVAIREVLPEVPAAALLATQRRAGDETGDGQEIAMAARLRRASVRLGDVVEQCRPLRSNPRACETNRRGATSDREYPTWLNARVHPYASPSAMSHQP